MNGSWAGGARGCGQEAECTDSEKRITEIAICKAADGEGRVLGRNPSYQHTEDKNNSQQVRRRNKHCL